MAFTSTLFKIQMPELTQSNFGENLAQQFRNIDSNFQKLANLGLTTGPAGEAAMWIPYNLNAVYCIPKITGGLAQDPHTDTEHFSSYYLDQAYVDQVEADYKKYYEITELGVRDYIYECALIYDALLAAIPNDLQDIIISDSVIYKRYWENDFTLDLDKLFIPGTTNNPYRERLLQCEYLRWGTSFTDVPDVPDIPINAPRSGADTENIKKYVGQVKSNGWVRGLYTEFLPSDILVAGNIENYFDSNGIERKRFIPISTTAHIFIDPRFRNEISISGTLTSEQLEQLSIAVDQSCVLYGQAKPEVRGELVFNSVFAFPRIFVHDGEFYLSINGIDTNIPLTGRTGASGADANFFVVRLAPGSNTQPWGNNSPTDDGGTYTVGGRIGSGTETELIGSSVDEELLARMDNQPAFIFPAANYAGSQYKTTYWIGHLHRDGNSIKVYCGPENRVDTDLYEHVVGGTMMGLDIYEKSVASPTGNRPWWKPRGLMLPIGTRAVDDAQNYAYFEYDDSSSPNPEVFGAHLIYSEKETGGANNKKYQLHISSINDYRIIGKPTDSTSGSHKPNGTDSGAAPLEVTRLFIDEPTFITYYGRTDQTLPGNEGVHSHKLLHVFGGQTIEGVDTELGTIDIAASGIADGLYGFSASNIFDFNTSINAQFVAQSSSFPIALKIKEGGIDASDFPILASHIGAKQVTSTSVMANHVNSNFFYGNRYINRDYGSSVQRILLANGEMTAPIPLKWRYDGETTSNDVQFIHGEQDKGYWVIPIPKPTEQQQIKANNRVFYKCGFIPKNSNAFVSTINTGWTFPSNVLKSGSWSSLHGSNKEGIIWVIEIIQNTFVTTARLLIAANGEKGGHDVPGSPNQYNYGIPLHATNQTNWDSVGLQGLVLCNSLSDLHYTGAGEAPQFIAPETSLTQTWAQVSGKYNGGGNRINGNTTAGIYATLTPAGLIRIDVADSHDLFAVNAKEWDQSNTRFSTSRYVEFIFTYPTKEQESTPGSTTRIQHYWKYVPVNDNPPDTSLRLRETTDGTIIQHTTDSEVKDQWIENPPEGPWYIIYATSDVEVSQTQLNSVCYGDNQEGTEAGSPWLAGSWWFTKFGNSTPGSSDDTQEESTAVPYTWNSSLENHDLAANVKTHLENIGLKTTVQTLLESKSAMNRWDGPHGSVSLSLRTGGEPIHTTGHLTIECWNNTFTQYFLEAYDIEYKEDDLGEQTDLWTWRNDPSDQPELRKILVIKNTSAS